ncbi:MAG TPA: zinc ribbon domain-containing protein [Candidatus Binatia bacterium]|nr:zinc ribbon domain-containing protein [Candidatus Binatia bacterium]
MDDDQRDRRDGPDPDTSADPEEAPRPDEPADEEAIPAEPSASAAEIESWPSQDATDAYVPGQEEARSWPTEPPEAGSAAADAWPTTPPERDEDRPDADAPEEVAATTWRDAPPGEVEAYPVASMPAAADESTAAHSVPESEASMGESTQCPRCGTENRAGLAFCRQCGQRLVAAGVSTTVERPGVPEGTMACPRCGTHNRAGVAFCQNCGANLRASAPGYVPPAVAGDGKGVVVEVGRRGAVLGPVVLLIGLLGLVTGYLLPFLYGSGSLFERAFGADGYGAAFWSGYPEVGAALADQAYFGLAGPLPLFALLLVALAVAGFLRARPGPFQTVGLAVALLWSVGLIVAFVVVEIAGNWSGDVVGLLRELTPAGIIFFLSSLIVLIGTLTRFGRS